MSWLWKNIFYWSICAAASLAALVLIFQQNQLFYQEYRAALEKIAGGISSQTTYTETRAWIEFDFGNGKRRKFEGALYGQIYPLDVALRAVAREAKFNIEIRGNRVSSIANLGGAAGSWVVYRNGKIDLSPIEKLNMGGGDSYVLRYTKN